MTTEIEATNEIYKKFISVWGGTLKSMGAETDIAFDNQTYDPDQSTEWVRLSVRHSLGTQASLGPKLYRRFERFGNILVQIFVPSGTATNRAYELGILARSAFEGEKIPNTNIRINNVTLRETGQAEDVWYQLVIDAEFVYTETK